MIISSYYSTGLCGRVYSSNLTHVYATGSAIFWLLFYDSFHHWNSCKGTSCIRAVV